MILTNMHVDISSSRAANGKPKRVSTKRKASSAANIFLVRGGKHLLDRQARESPVTSRSYTPSLFKTLPMGRLHPCNGALCFPFIRVHISQAEE